MSRLLIPRKCYLHVPGEAKEGFSIVLESFVLSKHQGSVHATFLLTLSTLNHLSGYTVKFSDFRLPGEKTLFLCLEESNHF